MSIKKLDQLIESIVQDLEESWLRDVRKVTSSRKEQRAFNKDMIELRNAAKTKQDISYTKKHLGDDYLKDNKPVKYWQTLKIFSGDTGDERLKLSKKEKKQMFGNSFYDTDTNSIRMSNLDDLNTLLQSKKGKIIDPNNKLNAYGRGTIYSTLAHELGHAVDTFNPKTIKLNDTNYRKISVAVVGAEGRAWKEGRKLAKSIRKEGYLRGPEGESSPKTALNSYTKHVRNRQKPFLKRVLSSFVGAIKNLAP